jgi:hypothetical protein
MHQSAHVAVVAKPIHTTRIIPAIALCRVLVLLRPRNTLVDLLQAARWADAAYDAVGSPTDLASFLGVPVRFIQAAQWPRTKRF